MIKPEKYFAAKQIIDCLKANTMGMTDVQIFECVHGFVAHRHANVSMATAWMNLLNENIALLLEEGHIESEFDYFFFKQDLPPPVAYPPVAEEDLEEDEANFYTLEESAAMHEMDERLEAEAEALLDRDDYEDVYFGEDSGNFGEIGGDGDFSYDETAPSRYDHEQEQKRSGHYDDGLVDDGDYGQVDDGDYDQVDDED